MLQVNTIDDVLAYVAVTGAYILSADTLNTAHIGPKMESHLKGLNANEYNEWLHAHGTEGVYTWGDNQLTDHEACEDLFLTLYRITEEACTRLQMPIVYGYFPDDGALLGWYSYTDTDE